MDDALSVPLTAAPTDSRRELSRSQLHALIAPYAKADAFHGYKSFLVDLVMYAAGLAAVIAFSSIWAKLAGGALAGAALVNLGALLHEAAHRAVVPSKRGNKVIAVLSMTLCLFNYRLWIYDHHVLHHRLTNVKGHNFLGPLTLAEYRALPRFRRALYRAYHSPSGLGILLYFLIERWPTVHFLPGAWLPRRFHRSAYRYAALIAAYGLTLLATLTLVPAASGTGFVASLLCGFVLPYAIWFAVFSMTVFLQHTHPEVRWYRDAASSSPEALSVRVHIPDWLNHMSHYVLEHPVHHVSAVVPHYKLRAAQKALEGIATPEVIELRFTPGNVRDVVTRCRLYDYDAHAWTDFDGTVTARPSERGSVRNLGARAGPMLPEADDRSSPPIFFPEGQVARPVGTPA